MRIIIAGAGEVGAHLAEMLSKSNHDITVIDQDEELVRGIDTQMDILTIVGSSSSYRVLEDAGIKNADLLIAVTYSEEVNILTAILGKKLGVKRTVARVTNVEYLTRENQEYFEKLGIDSIISPERLAADEIISLLKQTGTTEIFDFSGGKLSLFVIKLDEKAPIINKTLIEANQVVKTYDFRAVAITRKNKTIIPIGTDKFLVNDLVYVITNQEGIKSVLEYSGKEELHIKNVMVLGGSRIGIKTALDLQDHLNIKLIEINKEKSIRLADQLADTLVINGDGSNTGLLMEEGIQRMDAFIAVTGNAETNILSCMLAKKMGVKKTIAEIENIEYIELAENIGIDTIINKKLIAASNIYRFTMGAEVESVKCLKGTEAEVLEFLVKEKAKITKKELKNISFPKDAIIGGVVREDSIFIAKGDTKIQAGDKVVVFAMPKAISKVEKYFN